jgi:LacI family transcriptional regulator
MMATIRDIAGAAGVAVGTVSNVITGSTPVSEPLRRKVQAAIRRLGYQPNHIARSLKTSRTRTLGIVVPDLATPHYSKLIRGAETAAREKGYTMVVVTSSDDVARQQDLLSLLWSQRMDGVLLAMAAGPAPLKLIVRMAAAGVRVVCLDRIPGRAPVDSVSVDDVEAGRLGVRHLVEQGYRRIAIVTGPQRLRNERRRLLGAKLALEESGLSLEEGLVWPGNLLTGDLMEPPAPDAVFCTNGPTALGALRMLRQCGLRTPDHVGFVTIDELTADDLFYPTITAVVQPAYEIGWRAAEILLRRIEDAGPEGELETVRLDAALRVGDSSQRR